jgi:hypothetical protein
MSFPARQAGRGKPRLTVVRGCGVPVVAAGAPDWRRIAGAVLSCTHELNRHLLDQRWVRVDEVLRERRELLAGLARLALDAEARVCVRALEQAAMESEAAIFRMMGAEMGTAFRRQ